MAYAIVDEVKEICSIIAKKINDVKVSDLVKADGTTIRPPNTL